jgi:hypothetical protein
MRSSAFSFLTLRLRSYLTCLLGLPNTFTSDNSFRGSLIAAISTSGRLNPHIEVHGVLTKVTYDLHSAEMCLSTSLFFILLIPRARQDKFKYSPVPACNLWAPINCVSRPSLFLFLVFIHHVQIELIGFQSRFLPRVSCGEHSSRPRYYDRFPTSMSPASCVEFCFSSRFPLYLICTSKRSHLLCLSTFRLNHAFSSPHLN